MKVLVSPSFCARLAAAMDIGTSVVHTNAVSIYGDYSQHSH